MIQRYFLYTLFKLKFSLYFIQNKIPLGPFHTLIKLKLSIQKTSEASFGKCFSFETHEKSQGGKFPEPFQDHSIFKFSLYEMKLLLLTIAAAVISAESPPMYTSKPAPQLQCDDGQTPISCPGIGSACSIEECVRKECGALGGNMRNCPDGKSRCSLFPCPPIACTMDVKTCPDGSFVSRDPSNGCKFKSCPKIVIDCLPGSRKCQDGSVVYRDPSNNCQFKPCIVIDCSREPRKCPDGSVVYRDPRNKCQFKPCPVIKACPKDLRRCWDGSFVARDPKNKCRFKRCPRKPKCPKDVRKCWNGKIVKRNPRNKCRFDKCPRKPQCPKDIRACWDKSIVRRNPKNKCRFHRCPRKCPYGVKPIRCGNELACSKKQCALRTCGPKGVRLCSDGDYICKPKSCPYK